MIWTALCGLLLAILFVYRLLHRTGDKGYLYLGAGATATLLVAAYAILQSQASLSSVAYLVGFSLFLLALAVSSLMDLRSLSIVVLVSTFGVMLLGALTQAGILSGALRVIQMTVAICVVLNLGVLQMDSRWEQHRWIPFAIVIPAAALVASDGARTAMAVVTLSLGLFTVVGFRYGVWYRIAVFGIGLMTEGLVLVSTRPWNDWFGGDRGASLAGVSINTNGRANLITQSLSPRVNEPVTGRGPLEEMLIGQGVGSTSMEGATLGTRGPLNEFVRLYVEIGAIGVVIWIATLFSLVLLGLIAFTRPASKQAAFLLIGAPLSLGLYSLTENLLSYTWVLVPSGLLIARAVASCRASKPMDPRFSAAS